MFSRLKIKNFTAFESLDLRFSSGINIFVGANGTGKTHILKLLYCFQRAGKGKGKKPLEEKLLAVFRPHGGQINRMVRRQQEKSTTLIGARWKNQLIAAAWSNARKKFISRSTCQIAEPPVYIPPQEMLASAPGFLSLYDTYEMAEDEVYADTLRLAYLPPLKGAPAKEKQEVLDEIQELIGGKVIVEGDVFFLDTQRYGKLEMHLVAEGVRRLALIWQLIHNGTLLNKETTLFWDEPEANLNPIIMQYVAKILLTLANRGVQIFIATHNYAFLQEIDNQKNATPVTYFALDHTGEDGVQCSPCQNYQDISPNKIAEEHLRLYDMKIQRAFKGNP